MRIIRKALGTTSNYPREKTMSSVQSVLSIMRDKSMDATGHSWTRLNGALRSTMENLISAGVHFELNDVAKALCCQDSSYWSATEQWYSSACGSEHSDGGGNLSAALSLEKYLGRDPFIWAERTKTPSRLCVGSQFTWKGERVTVTSFDDKKKTLTACSYVRDDDRRGEQQVGDRCYVMSDYRILEARKDYEDGSFVARFSAKVDYEARKVKKRFCISNEEMKAVRADYDQRRRQHEKAIKAATTLEELEVASNAARDEGASAYRHFDLEILGAAVKAKHEAITEDMCAEEVEEEELRRLANHQDSLAKWLAGEDARLYFSGDNRLRVNGAFVECSNGNKVSLEAAIKTAAFVRRHREKGWEQNGDVHDVDAFQLNRIDGNGVRIGCTLITWEEVDRFMPLLKTRKANRQAQEYVEAGI